MKYKTSIFIFRRDLRLEDNTGLIKALKNSDNVIPIFIFTPEQLKDNDYKSNNCVQFMVESLIELNNELLKYKSKLYFFYGTPHIILDKIMKNIEIDALYVNMDYTPYSVNRDNLIKNVCDKYDIQFNTCEDILLNNINSILTGSNDIYTKFTPYFNKAKSYPVRNVSSNKYKNYINNKFKIVHEYVKNLNNLYNTNIKIIGGGRKNALNILNNIVLFKKYNKERNILSIKTTRLSAYIKFGCISIREVYSIFKKKLGQHNDLIKQLYWRDFYYNVTYNNPYVLSEPDNRNFKEKYNKIPWLTYNNAPKKTHNLWISWCNGTTGFPIVDACMRELNNTGFMHNRGRLITSNFLTKLLMWHWKDGEKYFGQNLVDYDPIINNGNWQWSAGSGVDAQPYFRIFNPWTQGEKFDPDCIYIKKWVPELNNVDNKHIHNWTTFCTNPQYKNIKYHKPIINYEENRKKCLEIFKKALY
jgi:deoxyribodipyrimidine photo-lyase